MTVLEKQITTLREIGKQLILMQSDIAKDHNEEFLQFEQDVVSSSFQNQGEITIYKLAKSWRPISLTNYILKALECLCGWHMDDAIKHSPVHTQQHGFCTDRNTYTAISSTVTDYIERPVSYTHLTLPTILLV